MNAITPVASLEPAPITLRSSDGLGWDGFAATLLSIRPGTYRVPAMAHHRISVHVGPPVRANCVCDGRRTSRIQAHGDADVIPAGVPGTWTDDADCRFLRIAITDTFVRGIGEQIGVRADLTPRLHWRDARVQYDSVRRLQRDRQVRRSGFVPMECVGADCARQQCRHRLPG